MISKLRRKFLFLYRRYLEKIKPLFINIQKYLFPDKSGLFPGPIRYRLMQVGKRIDWSAVPPARLLNSFPTSNWGGNDLFIADINGDGKPEFLWLQSPGIFKTEIYRERAVFSHLKSENPNLFCLTVTDTNGRLFWQVGSPQDDWLYCSHAAERMVCCYDIDGDGRVEVLTLSSQNEIIVLDGETGKLKAKKALPADNFAIIACGRYGPNATDTRILVSNSTAGYAPHSYGNPTLFLDSALNILHEGDFLGSGHCPIVFDADGDGYDEVLLGYELVDLHGRQIWTVDRWMTEKFSTAQHVDEAKVLGEGDSLKIAITGGDRVYVVDRNGSTLWSSTQPHAQYVLVGKFDSSSDENCLFITNSLNDFDRVACFKINGEKVWEASLPEHWPMGRPRCLERLPYFHKGVPSVAWKNHVNGKPDMVIYCEKGWPYAVGMHGKPIMVFPQNPPVRKNERTIPKHRPDDYGYSYNVDLADVNGDGVDEVIIYDRTHVWTYQIP